MCITRPAYYSNHVTITSTSTTTTPSLSILQSYNSAPRNIAMSARLLKQPYIEQKSIGNGARVVFHNHTFVNFVGEVCSWRLALRFDATDRALHFLNSILIQCFDLCTWHLFSERNSSHPSERSRDNLKWLFICKNSYIIYHASLHSFYFYFKKRNKIHIWCFPPWMFSDGQHFQKVDSGRRFSSMANSKYPYHFFNSPSPIVPYAFGILPMRRR